MATVKFWSAQRLPPTDLDKASRTLLDNMKVIFDGIANRATTTVQGTPLDSKVLAVTLLLRTRDMFNAALLLIDNNYYIEANTITRGIFENAFSLALLMKDPEAFKKSLSADDAASRKAVMNKLIELGFNTGPERISAQRLEEILNPEIARNFNIKNMAQDGGLSVLYGLYRFLSSDAAHVSANSLRKHTLIDDTNIKSGTDKDMPASRVITIAYEMLWNATAAAAIGTTEYLADLEGNNQVAALIEEYNTLFPLPSATTHYKR